MNYFKNVLLVIPAWKQGLVLHICSQANCTKIEQIKNESRWSTQEDEHWNLKFVFFFVSCFFVFLWLVNDLHRKMINYAHTNQVSQVTREICCMSFHITLLSFCCCCQIKAQETDTFINICLSTFIHYTVLIFFTLRNSVHYVIIMCIMCAAAKLISTQHSSREDAEAGTSEADSQQQ